MAQTVLRPIAVNFYRVAEAESWLAGLAAKGLFLSGLGRFFCTFEKRSPSDVRYRLEPMGKNPPDDEFMEACRLSGWEYAGCWRDTFTVWRADGDAPPEFHTDPVAQSFAFTKLGKKMRASLLISLLLCLIMLLCIGNLLSHSPLLTLLESRAVYNVPIWLLAVAVTWLSFRDWLAIRKLTQSLKAGVSMRHETAARPRPLILFWLLTLAVLIAGLVLPFYAASQSWVKPVSQAGGPLPFVRLGELEAENADSPEHANALSYSWNPLAPVRYTFTEQGELSQEDWENWKASGGDADRIPITLRSTYYELSFSVLGKELLTELQGYYSSGKAPAEWQKMTGFDADAILYSRQEKAQILLILKENQLLSVEYRGSEQLSGYMDKFLDKLALMP